MTAPLTRSLTYTFVTLSSSPSYRPSACDWNATKRPSWLTVASLVSEVETGAGNGANSVESPERIAVVPAGSVAADADTAENTPLSASTARITIERFGVMPRSHVSPVGDR